MDPVTITDISPYVGMGNMPIVAIDPDGDFLNLGTAGIGALVGGVIGFVTETVKAVAKGDPLFGKGAGKTWAKIGISTGKGALQGAAIGSGTWFIAAGVGFASEMAGEYLESVAEDRKFNLKKGLIKGGIAGLMGGVWSQATSATTIVDDILINGHEAGVGVAIDEGLDDLEDFNWKNENGNPKNSSTSSSEMKSSSSTSSTTNNKPSIKTSTNKDVKREVNTRSYSQIHGTVYFVQIAAFEYGDGKKSSSLKTAEAKARNYIKNNGGQVLIIEKPNGGGIVKVVRSGHSTKEEAKQAQAGLPKGTSSWIYKYKSKN